MRTVLLLGVPLLACSKPAEPTPARELATHVADVKAVAVSGEANDLMFAVTVASPDTGCDRYANWWEVVGEDGDLLYRRILRHSHVDDQPFERDGGPVAIAADTTVYVRAHMHPGGYGGVVMVGSKAKGFAVATELLKFDAAIESADPQPQGCDR